jgi:transposase-like protein
MYISGNRWVQKYADCAADRFMTDRRLVKKIFVDETLLKIDGQYYWLWVAYEPTLNACLMMHLSKEERFFFVCHQ